MTYVQYRKTLLSDNLSITLSNFKFRLKFTYGLPLILLKWWTQKNPRRHILGFLLFIFIIHFY